MHNQYHSTVAGPRPEMPPTPPDAARDFALGLDGFRYQHLHDAARLRALHEHFCATLKQGDPILSARFSAYHAGDSLDPLKQSELLIAVGAHLGPFVAMLFNAQRETAAIAQQTETNRVIFAFKNAYVGKRLRRGRGDDAPPAPPLTAAQAHVYGRLEAHFTAVQGTPELQAAQVAMGVLGLYQVVDRRPAPSHEELAEAVEALRAAAGADFADFTSDAKGATQALLAVVDAWHLHNMTQRDARDWVSYRTPKPIDPTHGKLVEAERPDAKLPEALRGLPKHMRARDGFALTDPRMTRLEVHNELDYCLDCHERLRDSCRHGLRDKQGAIKPDPKRVLLEGCPLDERISEAHTLREAGDAIAALAMVCIDNPMCPGTGHRICNDCMKACIFQKQEPVNIPQAETGILTDVLRLPYGFEIYSLLTRWNPLNRKRPYPLPYRGQNVLVAGMGPAGYTLAHYLLNEGFGVVGIDGLKIEPLPGDLEGRDGGPPRPVRDYRSLEDRLDERVLRGFGGVAEYGITVRWDKNFLKVLYLNLARRDTFAVYGGIRFGGTLTLDDAWQLGFDHVAIAAGAGRPTVVPMKNNLLRGMRAASDFLMGLQLTGAFKRNALANLQVELPAVVIGGGLTACDTATELAAYYPVQVEKLLEAVETIGLEKVMGACDDEEKAVVARLLAHGQAVREERQKPHPDLPALVRAWGGVTIAYRRAMGDSPAYRLNHEEVQKTLEEGIVFAENLTPLEAEPDRFGHVNAMVFRRADGSNVTLPARSVMVAAGTAPNVIYEREHPGTFALDARGRFFQAHSVVQQGTGAPMLKPYSPAAAGITNSSEGFFTSYHRQIGEGAGAHRFVSFYGDNHPRYAGNVVRAMASAKHGYQAVADLFGAAEQASINLWQALVNRLDDNWLAHVERVERLTPTIVEVVVRAPMQARKFKPGQFYRLQNYETRAPTIGGKSMVMEGLALTGAWIDEERGLLSMVALEMGTSSRLCATLRPNEPVLVMGPTGAPTEIPENENVVLCGGGLGNAVLFSVARAMRARGNRVVYFAGYRTQADMFMQSDVEDSADQVIWSIDHGPLPQARRPQDRVFAGNIVQAMQAYGAKELGDVSVRFEDVHRIVAIGSDRMMAAITRARKTVLAATLNPAHTAIASINSPMQCMMKEVCAQCLQRHVDPATGEESFVFSCFNQDQEVDRMDWVNLAARLRQNTVLEKVGNLWLDDAWRKATAAIEEAKA